MAILYRDSYNRLRFDMRLGDITQSAHRGFAIVCISEEPYCVNSYMIQRRLEALFCGHYCQRQQIEYTHYISTNSIFYKTRTGFIATAIEFRLQFIQMDHIN
jgi:hypothetical protein